MGFSPSPGVDVDAESVPPGEALESEPDWVVSDSVGAGAAGAEGAVAAGMAGLSATGAGALAVVAVSANDEAGADIARMIPQVVQKGPNHCAALWQLKVFR